MKQSGPSFAWRRFGLKQINIYKCLFILLTLVLLIAVVINRKNPYLNVVRWEPGAHDLEFDKVKDECMGRKHDVIYGKEQVLSNQAGFQEDRNMFFDGIIETETEFSTVKEIVQIAKTIGTMHKTVLVSVINDGYVPFLYSWLCNTYALRIHKSVLVITTDTKTVNILRRDWPDVNAAAIALDVPTGNQGYSRVGYLKIMVERAELLLEILKSGVNIMLTEFDYVWFANPVPLFEDVTGVDILINPVSLSDNTLNGGLIYTFATDKSIKLWEKLVLMMREIGQKLEEMPNDSYFPESQNDQEFFSELIRERYASVTTKLLPLDMFADGWWYFMSEKQRNKTHPIMISNNFIEGMYICVCTESDKKLAFDIEPSCSVRGVKNIIYEQEGIPVEQQMLVADKLLQDDYTLMEYSIHSEKALLLLIKSMTIYVKLHTGKVVRVIVKPTDCIRSVKEKIHKKEILHPNRQMLMLVNRELLDDQTLCHYKICQKTHLRLELRSMQIFVKVPSGMVFTLDVKPSDSIRHLKDILFDKEGIPPDHQILKFSHKVLHDSCTLSDYKVDREASLTLTPRSMQTTYLPLQVMRIFVTTPSGRRIMMRAAPSDLIRYLKTKLYDETEIPPHCQTLVFDGQRLPDTLTLSMCRITEDSNLHLVIISRIHVKLPHNERVNLFILQDFRVEDLKEDICARFGYPVQQQELSFSGSLLENDKRLSQYNITDGCTILLQLRKSMIQVCVLYDQRTVIMLETDIYDSIEKVKCRIFEKSNIPPEKQALYFRDELLEDARLMSDYNIKDGAILVFKFKNQILVSTGSGVIKLQRVDSAETIEVLKCRIFEQTDISPDRQHLYHHDILLDNTARLSDYNIKWGSTLQLEVS